MSETSQVPIHSDPSDHSDPIPHSEHTAPVNTDPSDHITQGASAPTDHTDSDHTASQFISQLLNDPEFKRVLEKKTLSRIKKLIQLYNELKEEDPNLKEEMSQIIAKRLQRALERSLYGVKEVQRYWYGLPPKTPGLPMGLYVHGRNEDGTGPRHYYRDTFANEHVLTVDFDNTLVPRDRLRMINGICAGENAKGEHCVFLGVKSGSSLIATFVSMPETPPKEDPRLTFWKAIVKCAGSKIAIQLKASDKHKDLQNLVILLNRTGDRALISQDLPWPTVIDDNDHADGVIAIVSAECMQMIIASYFNLPQDTKLVQCTILDRENGVAAKGCIRQCMPNETPTVFSASYKFGKGFAELNTRNLLIMKNDSLYNPRPKLSYQALQFDFQDSAQRLLVDQLFVPAVLALSDFPHMANARGKEKLMALGIGAYNIIVDDQGNTDMIKAENALKYHKRLVTQVATGPYIDGHRVIASWGNIPKFTVMVPLNSHYLVGQTVDIHRDPCLPVGNSTQRCKVIGRTNGNYAIVSYEPWTTIQGGDYDGDDITITDTTVKLLPNAVYDQTPMSEIESVKKSPFRDIESHWLRVEQARRVIDVNIGSGDLLARRLAQIGMLTRAMRLLCSRNIQAEIMSMKHEVDKTPLPRMDELKGIQFAIDYIRPKRRPGVNPETGEVEEPVNWEHPSIKGTIYEPIADAAVKVINMWLPVKVCDTRLIPIPTNKEPYHLVVDDKVIPIPQDDGPNYEERLQRCIELSQFYENWFYSLSVTDEQGRRQGETFHFEKLALHMKATSNRAKKAGSWLLLWRCMARGLYKLGNLNLICKALTVEELKVVYGDSFKELKTS